MQVTYNILGYETALVDYWKHTPWMYHHEYFH